MSRIIDFLHRNFCIYLLIFLQCAAGRSYRCCFWEEQVVGYTNLAKEALSGCFSAGSVETARCCTYYSCSVKDKRQIKRTEEQ